MKDKEYNLDRFLKAQELMYPCALREIKNGRKQTHWIWYIFPQLKMLGRSSTALYYGIDNLEEAKAYLEHPILGTRLREISSVLLALETNDPLDVMGYPDNLKLCSCMTLFSRVTDDDNQVFIDVITKFFDGVADPYTINLLNNKEGESL